MNTERIDGVVCTSCAYDIATVYEKQDGLRELSVDDRLAITIVDKEKKLGSIRCPKCGSEMSIDLGFFTGF